MHKDDEGDDKKSGKPLGDSFIIVLIVVISENTDRELGLLCLGQHFLAMSPPSPLNRQS